MKKFLLAFIMLMSSMLVAQTTQFTATAINVENPPYGLVAQVWNASTSTIYIDHVDVFGMAYPNQAVVGGVFQFGIGFSYLEENQCTPVKMILLDPINGPQLSTDTTVRASQQPCTPNGRPYGQANSDGTFNYTPTNAAPAGVTQLPVLAQCWALVCSLDYSQGLAILPNHGVTIYTAYYKDPYAYSWNGYVSVNFRGRK